MCRPQARGLGSPGSAKLDPPCPPLLFIFLLLLVPLLLDELFLILLNNPLQAMWYDSADTPRIVIIL